MTLSLWTVAAATVIALSTAQELAPSESFWCQVGDIGVDIDHPHVGVVRARFQGAISQTISMYAYTDTDRPSSITIIPSGTAGYVSMYVPDEWDYGKDSIYVTLHRGSSSTGTHYCTNPAHFQPIRYDECHDHDWFKGSVMLFACAGSYPTWRVAVYAIVWVCVAFVVLYVLCRCVPWCANRAWPKPVAVRHDVGFYPDYPDPADIPINGEQRVGPLPKGRRGILTPVISALGGLRTATGAFLFGTIASQVGGAEAAAPYDSGPFNFTVTRSAYTVSPEEARLDLTNLVYQPTIIDTCRCDDITLLVGPFNAPVFLVDVPCEYNPDTRECVVVQGDDAGVCEEGKMVCDAHYAFSWSTSQFGTRTVALQHPGVEGETIGVISLDTYTDVTYNFSRKMHTWAVLGRSEDHSRAQACEGSAQHRELLSQCHTRQGFDNPVGRATGFKGAREGVHSIPICFAQMVQTTGCGCILGHMCAAHCGALRTSEAGIFASLSRPHVVTRIAVGGADFAGASAFNISTYASEWGYNSAEWGDSSYRVLTRGVALNPGWHVATWPNRRKTFVTDINTLDTNLPGVGALRAHIECADTYCPEPDAAALYAQGKLTMPVEYWTTTEMNCDYVFADRFIEDAWFNGVSTDRTIPVAVGHPAAFGGCMLNTDGFSHLTADCPSHVFEHEFVGSFQFRGTFAPSISDLSIRDATITGCFNCDAGFALHVSIQVSSDYSIKLNGFMTMFDQTAGFIIEPSDESFSERSGQFRSQTALTDTPFKVCVVGATTLCVNGTAAGTITRGNLYDGTRTKETRSEGGKGSDGDSDGGVAGWFRELWESITGGDFFKKGAAFFQSILGFIVMIVIVLLLIAAVVMAARLMIRVCNHRRTKKNYDVL